MTCATTRKNLKTFANWANAHPFRGPRGSVTAWVGDGIEAVVGARPMTINEKVEAAFFGDKAPPSWTPKGAAIRLQKAADRLPQVRAAIALSEAMLAADKAAFFARFSAEDARALGAWMDAPTAALEGRPLDAGACVAPKVATAVAAAAIKRAAQ